MSLNLPNFFLKLPRFYKRLAVLSLDSDIRLPGQRRFKQRLLAMKNGVEVSELLISEIQNSMK